MGRLGNCSRRDIRFIRAADTSLDRGVQTDGGRIFDGGTAGKSKVTSSDGQLGLP